LISIFAGPFNSFYDEYQQTKILGINLWSHVGFGRYMGFVFIVSLINVIYLGFLKKFNLDKIFLLISFAGLLLKRSSGRNHLLHTYNFSYHNNLFTQGERMYQFQKF
jgi:hypothetical protein